MRADLQSERAWLSEALQIAAEIAAAKNWLGESRFPETLMLMAGDPISGARPCVAAMKGDIIAEALEEIRGGLTQRENKGITRDIIRDIEILIAPFVMKANCYGFDYSPFSEH